MTLFLVLVALSVVAVVVAGLVDGYRKRCAARTEENIKWVLDFNIKLGMDLGGVLGVWDIFESVSRAEMLLHIVKYYHEMMRLYDSGKSREEASEIAARKLSMDCTMHLPMGMNNATVNNYITTIGAYVGFYGQALSRLRDDIGFRNWVNKSEFTANPDMLTHAALKIAVLQVEDAIDGEHVCEILKSKVSKV